MSQAEELLNSAVNDGIAVASVGDGTEEERIIIHDDRTISVPASLQKIAVQHDHNVETVRFDCPRFWDGHDMLGWSIYINYALADGTLGSYKVTTTYSYMDTIDVMGFDWTITRNVTQVDGPISFLVCIKKTGQDGIEINHWNTEINTEMHVSKGMECTETIADAYPDVIEQILLKLDELDDMTGAKSVNGVPFVNGEVSIKGTNIGLSESNGTSITTAIENLDRNTTQALENTVTKTELNDALNQKLDNYPTRLTNVSLGELFDERAYYYAEEDNACADKPDNVSGFGLYVFKKGRSSFAQVLFPKYSGLGIYYRETGPVNSGGLISYMAWTELIHPDLQLDSGSDRAIANSAVATAIENLRISETGTCDLSVTSENMFDAYAAETVLLDWDSSANYYTNGTATVGETLNVTGNSRVRIVGSYNNDCSGSIGFTFDAYGYGTLRLEVNDNNGTKCTSSDIVLSSSATTVSFYFEDYGFADIDNLEINLQMAKQDEDFDVTVTDIMLLTKTNTRHVTGTYNVTANKVDVNFKLVNIVNPGIFTVTGLPYAYPAQNQISTCSGCAIMSDGALVDAKPSLCYMYEDSDHAVIYCPAIKESMPFTITYTF